MNLTKISTGLSQWVNFGKELMNLYIIYLQINESNSITGD